MTPQQLTVLDLAREMISANVPPSIRDVADQFDMPLSAARSVIESLIQAGALRRGPERTNNLRLAEQGDVRAMSTSTLVAELRRRGLDGPAALKPRQRDIRQHTCAIHTCDRQITTDKVMCGRHWFALPLDLQRGLKRTSAAGETARFDGLLATARNLIETGGARD